MKKLRFLAPIFSILALVALFLHLPEISKVLGFYECKTCLSSNPYFSLVSAAYFTLLIALSQLYPRFPDPYLARGGLIFSSLLAIFLIYMNLPYVCTACVFGHACHISAWIIWSLIPSPDKPGLSLSKERLFLIVITPISMTSFFASTDLTLKAYQVHKSVTVTLEAGDLLPAFTLETADGKVIQSADVASKGKSIINFISPECGHCKEQLQVLGEIRDELSSKFSQFINVCTSISQELIQSSSFMQWVEDKDGNLRKLFHVSGYPTLFEVGPDGKIIQVISGVPEHLKDDLIQ